MNATATHQVTVTNGVTMHSPQRAEFEFDRSKGEAFYVEVSALDARGDVDIDDSREFGPYLLVDAIAMAQHAQGQADPVAVMVSLDKADADARYPGNDWTGLLPATLKN